MPLIQTEAQKLARIIRDFGYTVSGRNVQALSDKEVNRLAEYMVSYGVELPRKWLTNNIG